MSRYPKIEISRALKEAGGNLLQFNDQDFNLGLEELGASQQTIESAVIRFDHYKRHKKTVTSEYDAINNRITLYSAAIRIAEYSQASETLPRQWSTDSGFNYELAYQAYKLANNSKKTDQEISPTEERQLLRVSRAKALTIYTALVGSLGGELIANNFYSNTHIEEIGGLIGAVVGSAVGLSSAAVLKRPIESSRQQSLDLIDERARYFSQSLQAIHLFSNIINFEFDTPNQSQIPVNELGVIDQPSLRLLSD